MAEIRQLPFGKPWITETERQAVLQVLEGPVLTHGPQALAFETEFAAFMGAGAHCVTVSSGMAALHLAYWQLGIGPGDEVIVPAQTHVATVHAVEVVGATPVFADCDGRDGNVDPDVVEALITKRTKAIGIVHFLGIPCDMPRIMRIAGQHGLRVIEDCALAVGAHHGGRHVGLFGDAACFSFYPVKHITTGDGGMFASRHQALAQQAAKARAFGVDRGFAERAVPGMYDVPTLGLNYRLSDINSALGRKQLERIGTILERRKDNFSALKACLSTIRGISVIDSIQPEAQNSHYCLSVVLEGNPGARRNAIVKTLNSRGVGTSVYYPQPVPRLTYYRTKYGYQPDRYRQAARISDQSIALPVGPHLSVNDMEYIGNAFAQAISENNE